jgi:uncharacterized phage-like protein YoqJ
MIVTGSGTRQAQLWPLEKKTWLLQTLKQHLTDLKPEKVIAGGAEGFDAALAVAAYDLKIPYVLALPNKGYLDYYWRRNSLTRTDRSRQAETMMSRAAEVVCVCSTIYDEKGQHANFTRNEWMLENAHHALVLDPQSPGTKHAYQLILAKKIPHTLIK